MEAKLLDQDSKVEGDQVVVTKTIEEKLNLQDLYNAKQNLQHQRQGIQRQYDQLKAQLDEAAAKDIELDELIAMLKS